MQKRKITGKHMSEEEFASLQIGDEIIVRTEADFIEELGIDWRYKFPVAWNSIMDRYVGKRLCVEQKSRINAAILAENGWYYTKEMLYPKPKIITDEWEQMILTGLNKQTY